jgi:hypothetical protein
LYLPCNFFVEINIFAPKFLFDGELLSLTRCRAQQVASQAAMLVLLFVPSGMEALETAINYWDDALAAYTSGEGGQLAVTSGEEAVFCRELQGLVDAAYRLQDQCELLFLDQVSGRYEVLRLK